MKNLKITAPEGYEIDKVNSTFENIVFKPIKKELPKSWEELKELNGYYVRGVSKIGYYTNISLTEMNKNIFATKEQAEASLALAQLSQLREVYRDGWKPDYNCTDKKYCIKYYNNVIYLVDVSSSGYFLSFQSAEVRDLFLENFSDLIEQAKPLMS